MTLLINTKDTKAQFWMKMYLKAESPDPKGG